MTDRIPFRWDNDGLFLGNLPKDGCLEPKDEDKKSKEADKTPQPEHYQVPFLGVTYPNLWPFEFKEVFLCVSWCFFWSSCWSPNAPDIC